MNRLGLLLAVVLASATSVACAAQADDDHEEDVAETEDGLISAQQQALTCKRFPKDSCVTIGRLCERRGGQLWCDLQGNCTCRLSVLQGSPAFAQ